MGAADGLTEGIMCYLYLRSSVGGAHGGEYHGGGTVTKPKLANHSASYIASAAAVVDDEERRREGINYTPASPKKGAYMGFSSEVMFGGL